MPDQPAGTIYSFDNFRLDTSRKLLLRLPGPETVQLTSKAFHTLLLLVENGGELVAKDALMSTVWRDSFVEEANLTQTISVLRKTLGESPNQHRFIVTESGKGYRFVAPVSSLTDQIVEIRNPGIQRSNKPYVFGAAALLLISLIVGAFYLFNKPSQGEILPSKRVVNSIAVLPFKNVESGQESQLLGIGMADAIITKLSKIKGIAVRQTTTVMRYVESTPEAIKAGREINVDAILEGSIQKADGRIRVSARMYHVSDGSLLWAESFDELDTNIFRLQDSISEKVANSLSLELYPNDRDRSKPRHTENIEAYNLYNKGRYFWNNRNGNDLRKSIELFEQALALDPNYALAWSGLAESYVVLQFFSHTQRNDYFPKAKEAAEKALSLDEDLAEPHAALALYKQLYEWDWEGAEIEFKRAIAINPNYGTAHQWYGEFLSSMGRFDESIARVEKAAELDPLSISTNTARAVPHLASGKYTEAIEKLKPALELDQNFSLALLYMGRAYDGLENYKEAIAQYQKSVKHTGGASPYFTASLINSYAKDGQRKEAEKQLKGLIKLASEKPVSNYVLARGLAPMGYKEEALEKLEKALDERDGLLIILKTDRNFDRLRTEPRFQKILERMRLNN